MICPEETISVLNRWKASLDFIHVHNVGRASPDKDRQSGAFQCEQSSHCSIPGEHLENIANMNLFNESSGDH
jgi:hypothetical protein